MPHHATHMSWPLELREEVSSPSPSLLFSCSAGSAASRKCCVSTTAPGWPEGGHILGLSPHASSH